MTKEKFEAYESVRLSGVTNMYDVSTVVDLSGGVLTKDDCFDIMNNYDVYKKHFERRLTNVQIVINGSVQDEIMLDDESLKEMWNVLDNLSYKGKEV